MPMVAGYVIGKDEPEKRAFIGISFAHKDSALQAFYGVLRFLRDPEEAEQQGLVNWRTIVLDRIAGAETGEPQITTYVFALEAQTAERFVAWAQRRLTGGLPANFRAERSLLDVMFSDASEMMEVLGIGLDDDLPESGEDDEYDEYDEDDSESAGYSSSGDETEELDVDVGAGREVEAQQEEAEEREIIPGREEQVGDTAGARRSETVEAYRHPTGFNRPGPLQGLAFLQATGRKKMNSPS